MAMSNNAFHRLVVEWDANMGNNDVFRSWVLENFTPDYLDGDFSAENMREIRKLWKKSHKVWYLLPFETYMSVEAMPFGGWKSEKDEAAFLKGLRACKLNSEIRAYMAQFGVEV